MEKLKHYSGKLNFILKQAGENLEDQCKRLVNEPLHIYYKNYIEMISDQFREKYIVYNDNIYEICEDRETCGKEDIRIYKQSDGSYNFEGHIYRENAAFLREYLLELLENDNQ